MTDPQMAAKEDAALRSVDFVESGMIVGLGTGSTAALVVGEIARRLGDGRLREIIGVPTSNATHQQALLHGIPLTTLDDVQSLDVTIDGADEVDPEGNLIKGLGGALLREKMVATSSQRLVIAVDESKLVPRLGTRAPLPVEVVTFGAASHDAALRAFGATPALRAGDDGKPFTTDEGHYIIDCRFSSGIEDPDALALALRTRPGVVETGLFLGMSPDVVVGKPSAG